MASAGMVSKWVLEQYIPKVPVQKQITITSNRKGKTDKLDVTPVFKSTNSNSGPKAINLEYKAPGHDEVLTL